MTDKSDSGSLRAYAKVFKGHKTSTSAAREVLTDLYHTLVADSAPKNEFEAVYSAGMQAAYFYILETIEAAENDGQ